MNGELSIKSIDSSNYNAMAKAMGISLDNDSNSVIKLPRLKIENESIMRDSKIDGKKVKEEIMEAGSFKLSLPEDENVFYGKSVVVRIFMQRFMYKKFFMDTKKYGKSVFSDNFNVDLKDTLGTFNLGRPLGFQRDWNSLPEELRNTIKSVKRVRALFGKIDYIGKVVDSTLNEVKFEETPFIWEIDNATGFKNMGIPLTSLAKQQLIPINHNISIVTQENVMNNGNSFYTPVPTLDTTKTVDITDNDQLLFTQFREFIENYNGWVVKEWEKNVVEEDISDEDRDIVDNFVDIEMDEESK